MSYWIIGTLILSVISPVFYTKSMLAGEAKPHRFTRLVVFLASVVGVLGVLGSTNIAGIVFALIFLARATYLLIMSGIYGVGGATRLDWSCLAIAVTALVLYAISGNGLLAISFAMLADFIGYIPTFVKTWRDPTSEDPLFFGIEGLAALLGVFAIAELRVDVMFPVFFLACCVLMLFLIYRPFANRGATPSAERVPGDPEPSGVDG